MQHVVAIVGGAVAGSEAAVLCAERGISAVVFEQGDRPYGKIEDGLPRWHDKLRTKEYAKIDENLSHPLVRFVPQTRIGTDLSFEDLRSAGFSALIFASGAWRDRPLPIENEAALIGRGLLYQNPLVGWFNHSHEAGAEPWVLPEGALVVGGGLASIDVVKILSLETHARALRAKGIEVDVVDLEHKGIPRFCSEAGVEVADLGVEKPTLHYRRTMDAMPLASAPDGATEAQQAKVRGARVKIMERVMDRYCVDFAPLSTPVGPIVEGGHLVGLQMARTEVVDGRVKVTDEVARVRTPLVVGSIGSVPVPIPGIPMKGELYDYADWNTGEIRGLEGVFGLGNVLTGKGNIKDSRANAREITQLLLSGHLKEAAVLMDEAHATARAAAEPAIDAAAERAADPAAIDALVEARWKSIGYPGSYAAWMERHRPE